MFCKRASEDSALMASPGNRRFINTNVNTGPFPRLSSSNGKSTQYLPQIQHAGIVHDHPMISVGNARTTENAAMTQLADEDEDTAPVPPSSSSSAIFDYRHHLPLTRLAEIRRQSSAINSLSLSQFPGPDAYSRSNEHAGFVKIHRSYPIKSV